MDPPEPATAPPRPSISERAERRRRVQAGGSDRYSSLMRALHAGEEVPLRPRQSRSLEWHPIAAKLVVAAIVGVLAYSAIVYGYNAWRNGQVDTWSGPDATVTSGQRLADCPVFNALHDDTFPTWIRFEGKVYRNTGSIRPIGSDPTGDFPVTPYTLGELRLLRVGNTPDGKAGKIIVLRLVDVLVGQTFEWTPECT